MSEILIDVSRLVGRLLKKKLPTGIDRVGMAYIRHFQHRANAYVSFRGMSISCSRTQSDRIFDWILHGESAKILWSLSAQTMISGASSKRFGDGILLNTGHTNLESQQYVSGFQKRGLRPLYFIHDLIPLTHPQYCRAGEYQRHAARIRNAMATAKGIICNSLSTLRSLEEYCEEMRLPLPRSIVAPLALEDPGASKNRSIRIEVDERSQRTEPFFVMLSTIEPRKNHLMILQIWERLIRVHGVNAPKLHLVGQKGWEGESVDRILSRSPILKGVVTEHVRMGDLELRELLQGARALLFPSFVEGFGMPVMEALAFGTPVIASDLPVFREFAADVPDYIDPLDAMAWMDTVMNYASASSLLRQAQIVRMRDYTAPTWADHFERVDGLIEQIETQVG